ncbi:MAG: D-glycero-beta-D-manno-heptose 1-phosphate adenylyltransferase [Proteobacteria bacterium]|jgi:D-beta-D-heptose 7-phosphate kinase/D-beta-D-heptose 1-phosphate adenosyltransferase|nr:D-glycero-beta-D-manno-heptose 1-phosphate adenylyltransferase [Pseudomonadota bacterium]
MGQILRRTELQSEAFRKTIQGKKLVFTNGCFDLLHVGHIRYLQEAKACGDLLFVGLNTDESVKKLKGPTRPIQNESDRAEIMAALGCVDFVCLFSEETPEQLIHQVRPQVLVKGGDWKIDQIVGSDFVIKNGGEVKSLQFVDGRSTTKIIEKSQS